VTERFYRYLAVLSRYVGLWLVGVTAAVVAAGYFVLLPRRLGHSVRFYRALFPERSALHAFLCAWRQYQDFAALHRERLEIERRIDVRLDSEGECKLARAKAEGRGAILVMSHFGRWEIGARLLARRQEGLTLVMGGMASGGARAGVDRDLRAAGLDVRTVSAGQGQAFDILQASQILRAGGIVSLSADRAFGDARMLRLPFLSHVVSVAAAPFALALASGAPLLVVFVVKIGRRHYRLICDDPITLTALDRGDRPKVMETAALAYLQRLHDMMEAYPEQWQTFGQFLLRDRRLERES
jgi:lauroyl/myristoyl acyltransferase